MSFLKSLLISIAASLISGVLLFFLNGGITGFGGRPVREGPKDGYAVLTLDASYPDRLIRELLTQKRIINTIGESSQWVFLDDFGELEKVPLDSYRDRVEPFDLRNDGYAERLRSFFVFQEERRLFIPLKGNFGDLEGRIRSALGDIPFSLAVLTPPGSVILPAVLFAAAAVFTLLLSGEALFTAFFLPLWAVLSALGVPGFALIAVLAGLSRLLRDPVREYFVSRRYKKPPNSPRGFAALGAQALPGTWALSALFLAALGIITFFGTLPWLTVIMGLFFFLVILCLSLRAESYRGDRQGHIRFLPVPISDMALRPSGYSRIMFPFTLAVLLLLFLPVFFFGNSAPRFSHGWIGWKGSEDLNAEMYRDHVRFQQNFSFMPLSSDPEAEGPSQSYRRYSLGGDGLIDVSGELFLEDAGEIPPFPLEGLIDFMNNYTYIDPGFTAPRFGGLICLLISLGLCIPLILWDWRGCRMKGKFSIYIIDKQIAA
ncbi:MAG: hypothetical protein LBB98_08285 [Treponema sp.]|jgi:hypothetical protein|nr:hypothetical protein [Treponema sp.]